MKRFLLLFCTLGLAVQAQAMTAAEFTSGLVAQVNEHLSDINEQRPAEGKKLYCTQLNQKQIALIQTAANEPDITVEAFVEKVSNNLECYAPFWQPWGHTDNLAGVLFNSKAYAMDTILIRESLENYAGREPNDNEALLGLFD